MGNQFQEFVGEVEEQASPEELRNLEAARTRFRLGSRLLQQRVAAGFTQQQLAQVSGIAQADISRIERGQSNPTTETLEALGKPLGVTLDLVVAAKASEEEAS